VCPALGILVTSDNYDDTLNVYALPNDGGVGAVDGMLLMYTLGGPDSPPPMQFNFGNGDGNQSGWVAFACGPEHHLLLTDAGKDAVHVIDVVARAHVGYVGGGLGCIPGPRGVAAKAAMVAVSSWREDHLGDHTVWLFEGAGSAWTLVRKLGSGPVDCVGMFHMPLGLRFTADGTGLAVADYWNDRVSLFSVPGGAFVRYLATNINWPVDIEEDIEKSDRWFVACWGSDNVEYVADGEAYDRDFRGLTDFTDATSLILPSAVALVPGLGLVVRERRNDCVQVFASPDAIAMSGIRVAWMGVVARARFGTM